MREKIAELKKQRNEHKQNGETEKVAEVDEQIKSTRQEMNETYKRMKAEEKAEQERIRNEEKEAEREFEELLKQREAQQDAGASESSGASQQKPGGDSSR
jgi:hypothetical protein